MNCDDAIGLTIDSLMDSLDERRAGDLREHLRRCASCADEARALREAWEGLARLEVPAPEGRAGETVGALRERSPQAPERARWVGATRLAASFALLLTGALAGYAAHGRVGGESTVAARPGVAVPVAAPDDPTFLMLVRGQEPDRTVPGDVLVAEYGAWALELAAEGRLAAGAKLADEPGRWVSGASTPDERVRSDVSGYFVIRAPDYDAAVDLAMASPHVRYGGVFEIRAIDLASQ